MSQSEVVLEVHHGLVAAGDLDSSAEDVVLGALDVDLNEACVAGPHSLW